MKKATGVLWMLLFCLHYVLSPTAANGEMVEHHGVAVDSEGSVFDCLSCHNGSAAGSVSYCTVKCDFRSTSHSILKHYPPKKNRDSYAAVESVRAKGVKIIGGKVTCLSCHNLKNPGKGHLIVDDPSKLCVICHISSLIP